MALGFNFVDCLLEKSVGGAAHMDLGDCVITVILRELGYLAQIQNIIIVLWVRLALPRSINSIAGHLHFLKLLIDIILFP